MTPINLTEARNKYEALGPLQVSVPQSGSAAPREGASSDVLSANEALLLLAKEYERTAEFKYVKKSGDIATRRVEPDVLSFTRDGTVLVTGYDPDRCDTRAYRSDRIRGTVAIV